MSSHNISTTYKGCDLDWRNSETTNIAGDLIMNNRPSRDSDGQVFGASTSGTPVGNRHTIAKTFEGCKIDKSGSKSTNIAGSKIVNGVEVPGKSKAAKSQRGIDEAIVFNSDSPRSFSSFRTGPELE